MEAELYLSTLRHLPYIMVNGEKVMEASNTFANFTGYSKDNIIQKTIATVWSKLFKDSLNISDL